ncbi:MAG: hypothetical protein WC613_02440 [Candidatus Aenigmatarchaeota archaeon]
MAYDIGTSLFVELLGMTQYPGSPFTGNIFRDLIMFFIVPTIFIIMVLYIMSGRIIPNRNFRVMLGVGAYLFIIAGGYYSFFALLAGPYFIFLIFILGVLGYLGSHFRPHGGGGGGGYSRSRYAQAEEGERHSREEAEGYIAGHRGINVNFLQKHHIQERIHDLEAEIKEAEQKRREAKGTGDEGRVVSEENKVIREANREIRELKKAMKTVRI